ncbi:MAG TPA: glycosyltransferase family 4 protein [Solirubrobacteraceae bacterium]|nr:glycosyltransferase family 4 protein [Solirubrobacteraceae bacterium]
MRRDALTDPNGTVKASSSPIRLLPSVGVGAERLRIAVLAPPWIPVPPPGYGGVEAVIDLLCEALVARGHEVTLFAAPGSRSPARVYPLLDDAHPNEFGSSLYESDHVAAAWRQVDLAAERGERFDVLHDHSGFTALAMADRVAVPVVHTVHGTIDGDTARFYRRHGHKALLVALSRAQAQSAPDGVRIAGVVPNPIRVDCWPLRKEKEDYVLWMGRMDPVKGAHRAIEAARLAGRTLVLAGPVQPGQEHYFRERVEPHLDDRRVHYVGEVAGVAKQELFANAAALLMPIRWREPFGMVMVEALACGTPVIAFAEGAAAEIVLDGENGLLVGDEAEMARAISEVDSIDPLRCRSSVAERYDMAVSAAGYERLYRQAIHARDERGISPPPLGVLEPRRVHAQPASTGR